MLCFEPIFKWHGDIAIYEMKEPSPAYEYDMYPKRVGGGHFIDKKSEPFFCSANIGCDVFKIILLL